MFTKITPVLKDSSFELEQLSFHCFRDFLAQYDSYRPGQAYRCEIRWFLPLDYSRLSIIITKKYPINFPLNRRILNTLISLFGAYFMNDVAAESISSSTILQSATPTLRSISFCLSCCPCCCCCCYCSCC